MGGADRARARQRVHASGRAERRARDATSRTSTCCSPGRRTRSRNGWSELWALQRMHITPLWPSFLAAPPYNYAFLSNPVVDPDFIDEVIAAFFDAIERERSLPNVIRLRYLDGSSETYPAIMNALAARGGQALKLSERERPYVHQGFRAEEIRLDAQEAAAGLEPAERARRRRHRQRAHAARPCRTRSKPISRWKPRAGKARAAPRCCATRRTRPSSGA